MQIGIIGLLGIGFVVMKLMGYIDWSWFYVTAPFWGGAAIAISIMLLVGLGAGSFFGISSFVRRKRR